MAEMQEESGGRLMPMGILPFWDIELAVAEIDRMHQLGLHGINTTSAPHDHGLPDLGTPHWDPVWEAASDLGLPINFHIGSSESAISWYGTVPWPSLNDGCKLGLGSAMLYINNATVVGNMIYSGVLERFPTLQVVSVESGIGWIPFVLQRAGLPDQRHGARGHRPPQHEAVGLLPAPVLLVLLVRAAGHRRRH